jgi:O-antigen/teichoic acid export membrane protein
VIQISRLFRFIRTDVIWVATGQLVALIVGLLSLKIFTNLFAAEQYAYIALMMAFSAWIWTGIYQPLNQTIFRFYPLAVEQGWQDRFLPLVLGYENKIVIGLAILLGTILLYGYQVDKGSSFYLLILLSVVMGISYGCVHGVVSFFLAQRRRKPVTALQSFDGLFRLLGGLLAYYFFSQTEYAVATGMAIAGVVLFALVMHLFWKKVLFKKLTQDQINRDGYKQEFLSYFRKMFVVMILNASIIHLDKWLLFVLIGSEGLGKYAIIYLLAMTIMSVIYFFFEMLGFPIIFNQKSVQLRKQFLRMLLFSYTLSVGAITFVVYKFGESILLFFTTQYVASEYQTFSLLVVACGLLNFGRILMVHGQIEKEPHMYWPAYLVLLCVFVGWCLLFVKPGQEGFMAAQGFVFGTMIFVGITALLNFKKLNIGKGM